MRRIATLALTAALAALPVAPAAGSGSLRVLLANVGNSNVHCQPYAFKLCFRAVEARVAAAIRSAQPDIVGLIEVMPLARCASAYGGAPEVDPQKVCSPLASHELPHQVQRLVGPGYSIACDARFAWDCVAVRDSRAELFADGCSGAGCFALNGITTAPALPGCDAGFTVGEVALGVPELPDVMRVVLAHPDSGFTSGQAGVVCRTQQLEQAFAFAEDGTALLFGDFNMDPFRMRGPDVDLWNARVGDGKAFRYHSGPAERTPPHPTHFAGESANLLPTGERLLSVDDPSGAFARTTIDHVTSDFLSGACRTLGEAPGTTRLDGGGGGGMDHRALLCDLTF